MPRRIEVTFTWPELNVSHVRGEQGDTRTLSVEAIPQIGETVVLQPLDSWLLHQRSAVEFRVVNVRHHIEFRENTASFFGWVRKTTKYYGPYVRVELHPVDESLLLRPPPPVQVKAPELPAPIVETVEPTPAIDRILRDSD